MKYFLIYNSFLHSFFLFFLSFFLSYFLSFSLSFFLFLFFSATSRRRVFEAEVVEDGSDEELAGFLESESNDGERGGRGRGRGGLEEGDGVSGIGESKIHFILSLCLMPLFCLSVRVVR